ncbi:MAG TPA: DUF1570 domain-containing protein, partial [Planctomycetaceae bacterium]|nr:DUF1570 domain-containing protein [Planctomycetaceae bacterium]
EDLETPFKPYTAAELGERLQAELGPGFEIHTTEHYVLCSNAGKPYVKWCGRLFERLYTAFHDYWKKQGLELTEPEFPLVAIILADEIQFGEFATKDAGPDSAASKGYFSIPTNRMVLYDLTAAKGKRAGSEDEIERNLSAAPYNTATVVHEATHQIAFNSGMHKRFADNPLWLTEGMAMFFETPDLRSKTGWKTVGSLNRIRVKPWLDFVANRRKSDSLRTLLGSDNRFTDPATAGDAYAESWALTWYLIKNRGQDYTKYLQRLSQKPRLEWLTPSERLKEFQAVFGDDLDALDRDFTRYMKQHYGRNK